MCATKTKQNKQKKKNIKHITQNKLCVEFNCDTAYDLIFAPQTKKKTTFQNAFENTKKTKKKHKKECM